MAKGGSLIFALIAKMGMISNLNALQKAVESGKLSVAQKQQAAATIRALPEAVNAVGGRIEVLLDGGIRSGQDVLKALALGARGTLIGRAFLYGLGAMGEKGVTRVLEIIRSELDVTMALCGLRDVKDASPAILRR